MPHVAVTITYNTKKFTKESNKVTTELRSYDRVTEVTNKRSDLQVTVRSDRYMATEVTRSKLRLTTEVIKYEAT